MKGLSLLLILLALACEAVAETERAARRTVESIFTGVDSGGQTTVFNKGRRAYTLPLANLLEENRQDHVVGNSLFNENWVAAPASAAGRDGLGPLFHARSCSSCHELDGRGKPPENGEVMTSLLLRLSIPGKSAQGGPVPDPVYGSQLAPRALAGLEPEAEVTLTEKEIHGHFPDGTEYVLRQPIYAAGAWHYGTPSPDLMIGPRVAPPVFGLGLLEAVPEERIQRLADPDDADNDGISGRPNRVWNPDTGGYGIGRFGWKANTATLRRQTADALLNDMGLTSPGASAENHTSRQPQAAKFPSGGDSSGAPELTAAMLDQVTHYVRTLAPPARRGAYEAPVRDGQRLFHSIGCTACHRATLNTGSGAGVLEELAGQTIHPYTDLLLHDMGPGLADHRPDYEASGSEWRTAPLWGLGLLPVVNGHERLLHDGRARGIAEAILWHDGEARAARDAWMALLKDDREKVLSFIRSL
jgi:CxxC motif-containing protein (DUF1111 family)